MTVARRALGWHVLRRVVVPGVVVYLVLVGTGLLLAHPFRELADGEDVVNRDLAGARTPAWSTTTDVISTLADTASIMALLLVFVVVLRWILHRWAEAVTLTAAVLLQATIFLLTTVVIDRQRPDVVHLDAAPPTSSFPSGHTGAAVALYGGLAVIVGWRLRPVVPRTALVAVLVSVPLLVATARLYRGMHHPSDVLFGAVNGLACLTIAVRAFLPAGATRKLPPPARCCGPSPRR